MDLNMRREELETMEIDSEGLQLLSPIQFSPMKGGNNEWAQRSMDKGLARRLVAAQVRTGDPPPQARFTLQAHGWWHPQVGLGSSRLPRH